MSRKIGTAINRLLELAELVRTLEPSNFSMANWCRWKDSKNYNNLPKKPTQCKTTACIGGWATWIHPDLYLSKDGDLCHTNDDEKNDTYVVHPFAKAFHLTEKVADDLTYYKAPHQTPKAAAKAVEKVAADLAKKHGYDIVTV